MGHLEILEQLLVQVSLSALSVQGQDNATCSATEIWNDPRLIPAYASAVSVLWLLITLASRAALTPSSSTGTVSRADSAEERIPLREKISEYVKRRGGWVVYAFNFVRLLGTAALVGLSTAAVVLSSGMPHEGAEVSGSLLGKLGGGRSWDRRWDCTERAEIALLVGYIYATLLSLLALVLAPPVRGKVSLHAAFLLFAQFLVFTWRNLLPLTTVSGEPADGALPWLMWTRGVLVALVGCLLPALVPRVYVPYDPLKPVANPAPEQTASIVSFIFFLFLDPIVLGAWRAPQLPYEQLPPLPDTDWSDNLRTRSMDVLDPVRRREQGLKDRHLFWGLMFVFRWDYARMIGLLILEVLCHFLVPIGMNRLLTYMEHGGESTDVRPWVWIAFVFFGRTLNTLMFNLYIFTSTRMIVQCESILTQVIFEHALRVRLTDDIAISSSSASEASLAPEASASTITAASAVSVTNLHPQAPSFTGTDTTTLVEGEGSPSPPRIPLSPSQSAPSERGISAPAISTALLPSPVNPKQRKHSQSKVPANQAVHLSAKINNMFGTDIGNLVDGRDFPWMMLDCPFEAILCAWFLWVILGWAAVVGMVFMALTLPIPGLIASRIQDAQMKLMHQTDVRVQAITESLGIIRMIKMFSWEKLVKDQVNLRRNEELYYVQLRKILELVNNVMTMLLPMITMVITYAFYTLVMKQELDAARVFSSVPVFETLRNDMAGPIGMLTSVIKAKVSLDRISDFLRTSQLLDRYHKRHGTTSLIGVCPADHREVVGFCKATFTWTDPANEPILPAQRNFRLQMDDLIFRNGEINIIVGPTGCGKTSILMALLGEMHFEPQDVDAWYSLPRERGIAYAAQESWVQNDTIRANILFGSAYDETRYRKVVYQCGLEPDIAMFRAGDETEVGERGLTLSGGQKARITLARAVYSDAGIILLDDIVSALDVHTARWVINECLQGDLINGRTVLLVTHAVALIAPIATNVISLSSHGRVIKQGLLSSTLATDPILREEFKESEATVDVIEALPSDGGKMIDQSAAGKLVVKEEMAEGRIRWQSIKLFADAFGGISFWIFLCVASVVVIGCDIAGPWWLGRWAQAYENRTQIVDVVYYLTVFMGIIALQEVLFAGLQLVYTFASVCACRRLHDALCNSVLGSTLRWIDSTPVGRIVSRFTQDIREIDGPLTEKVQMLLQLTIQIFLKFAAIIVISPVFGIPGAIVVVAGLMLGQIYVTAQMCVKRLRSNWRSPLYNHFSAAVSGLISVRAYGAEEAFKTELRKRADAYSRPSHTFYNLNRWISTRADLVGALFTSGLATYLVYGTRRSGASTTGFSLTMAIEFSAGILMWVLEANRVEISANSIERLRDYLVIDHEPVATDDGKPPAYWPASGTIRVDNLSARYSADGPLVLQNLNFEIKSGERVGIVGRTGSGKSSLALSLLRLIPTEGHVYFDGRRTTDLNLDALRTNLAIIPQEPTLISGSLRSNLDPYAQHDDAALYDALCSTGLMDDTGAADGTNLSLETTIANAGSNFSVGQRQLIALARAILRGTKVLILDEATASVDADTDAVIQTSIRAELQHATLITIAHRLLTIMDYDKIMVLDAGKLMEFDSPLALLQNEKSYFRSLVDESGDSERLMSIAQKGRTG